MEENAPIKQRKLRDNFLNRLRQDAYEATPFSADSILPQTPQRTEDLSLLSDEELNARLAQAQSDNLSNLSDEELNARLAQAQSDNLSNLQKTETEDANRIDTLNLQEKRDNNDESDDSILDRIVKEAGTVFLQDNKLIDINEALKTSSSTQILDFMFSGQMEDKSIESGTDAFMKGIGTGTTNAIGGVVDLTNAAMQGVEYLFRKSIGASTDPEDYFLSSTKPIGGGDNVRSMFNGLYSLSNLGDKSTILNSIDQVPEEFKTQFAVGNVVGENVGAVTGAGALVGGSKQLGKQLGIKLNNPLYDAAMAAPKKFVAAEVGSTAAQAAAAGAIENSDIENPYAKMGIEFTAAALGGMAADVDLLKSIPNAYRGARDKLMSGADTVFANFGGEAAKRLAISEFLKTAAKQRLLILEEAKLREQSGDIEGAGSLYIEADQYLPEKIVSDIEAALSTDNANLPAGSLATENQFLMSMQNTLTAQSSEFSGKVDARVDAALQNLMAMSELMARSGNTAMANALQTRYFQQTLNSGIAKAQQDAKTEIATLAKTDTQAASLKAQEVLFDAKKTFRNMETALWGRIDQNTPVPEGASIAETIGAAQGSFSQGITLGEGSQYDAALNAFMRDMQNGTTYTTGRLLKFRSDMLAAAAQFGANKDFKRAAAFDDIASAVVDQLSDLPPDPLKGDTIGFARAFSVELNDRFTRNFPSKVLQTGSDRATTIRGEEVLQTATGSGGDAAQLNLKELQRAATDADILGPDIDKVFEADELRRRASAISDNNVRANVPTAPAGDPFNPNTAQTMPTDDDIIPEVQVKGRGPRVNTEGPIPDYKTGFEEGFDVPSDPSNPIPEYTIYDRVRREGTGEIPETPEVDNTLNMGGPLPEGVGTQVDKPSVRIFLGDEMQEAQENFLRARVLQFTNTDGSMNIEAVEQFKKNNPWIQEDFPEFDFQLQQVMQVNRDAVETAVKFSSMADTEKLPDAINSVIESSNPIDNFNEIISKANGDPQSLQDIRLATMDMVLNSARTNDGGIDFFRVLEKIGKPLSGSKGDTSLLELLVDTKVLSNADAEAFAMALDRGLTLQRSQTNGRRLDKAIENNPSLINNIARIAGANFGTQFGFGSGAQLQAASIGSNFFKKFIDDAPGGKALESLQMMMLNPRQLAAAISENPKIIKDAGRTAREFFNKYGGMTKQEMAAAVRAEASQIGIDITPRSVSNSISLFTSSTQEDMDAPYMPTLESQMMNLGLPEVNLPKMYPSPFVPYVP